MPLIEINQSRHVSASVRLDATTATMVNQYAAFIRASADEVVDKALNYVFAKDREFQDYLRTAQSSHSVPTLRIRKIPSNGVTDQPLGKPVSGVELGESAQVVKA